MCIRDRLLMIAYMGSMLFLFGQFFLRKYVLGKNEPTMCGVVKMDNEVTWTTYRGQSMLGNHGSSEIQISKFQNRHKYADWQYSLTPVGAGMPELHVSEEVNEQGVFCIGGGVPGKKVSWQAVAADQEIIAQLPNKKTN
eukprot:TRINITY_DN24255_c0_g1_i3.p1 TRINITY_DN24255_c0_g1~~TRINITY_DN24255_c0_g1_i3.p1  ORF type:complete len:139 (-),score=50.68 TRINITY_DN24255_c0_g1_i3:198-614(-)